MRRAGIRQSLHQVKAKVPDRRSSQPLPRPPNSSGKWKCDVGISDGVVHPGALGLPRTYSIIGNYPDLPSMLHGAGGQGGGGCGCGGGGKKSHTVQGDKSNGRGQGFNRGPSVRSGIQSAAQDGDKALAELREHACKDPMWFE